MAQKVTVALEDDLDGGPADETVRFGFDGADYEIDLSAKCLFLNLSGAVRRPARSRQDWSCDPDCRADIAIALRVWCGGCLVRRLPGLLRLAAISPAHP
jgi:Lsr2